MQMKELRDMGWDGDEDEDKTQRQFRIDMAEADREISFYSGRFFYRGWATKAEDFNDVQAIIRATSVQVQLDQLGKVGYIVYPQ